MTYRAVGFDYDGVLKGTPWSEFQREMARILDVPEAAYNEAFENQRMLANPNLGQVTWAVFWEDLVARLHRADRLSAVVACNRRRIMESPINEDVVAIAQELKATGYRIGILTNNSADARTMIRSEGFERLFDAVDISEETGVVKPEPAAFKHLAAGLGIDVGELIFIDDNQSSLRKAATIGYTPILFQDSAQLRQALVALGVLRHQSS